MSLHYSQHRTFGTHQQHDSISPGCQVLANLVRAKTATSHTGAQNFDAASTTAISVSCIAAGLIQPTMVKHFV